MMPVLSATLVALAIISTAFKPANAQAPPPCELATLFAHLGDIQGMCCSDGNECASGYPGADDACSRECGELFEPFWDSEFYLRSKLKLPFLSSLGPSDSARC